MALILNVCSSGQRHDGNGKNGILYTWTHTMGASASATPSVQPFFGKELNLRILVSTFVQ